MSVQSSNMIVHQWTRSGDNKAKRHCEEWRFYFILVQSQLHFRRSSLCFLTLVVFLVVCRSVLMSLDRLMRLYLDWWHLNQFSEVPWKKAFPTKNVKILKCRTIFTIALGMGAIEGPLENMKHSSLAYFEFDISSKSDNTCTPSASEIRWEYKGLWTQSYSKEFPPNFRV